MPATPWAAARLSSTTQLRSRLPRGGSLPAVRAAPTSAVRYAQFVGVMMRLGRVTSYVNLNLQLAGPRLGLGRVEGMPRAAPRQDLTPEIITCPGPSRTTRTASGNVTPLHYSLRLDRRPLSVWLRSGGGSLPNLLGIRWSTMMAPHCCRVAEEVTRELVRKPPRKASRRRQKKTKKFTVQCMQNLVTRLARTVAAVRETVGRMSPATPDTALGRIRRRRWESSRALGHLLPARRLRQPRMLRGTASPRE